MGLQTDAFTASTMAFAVLCLSRLWHGFNCRSTKSIFQLGLFSNKFAVIAFLAGFIMLFGVIKLEIFHEMFEIANLSSNNLNAVLLLPMVPFVLIQIYKIIRNSIKK